MLLQVGFKVTPKAIAWDSNRINPLKGIVTLVSVRGRSNLLKSIAKITVVGLVVYLFLRQQMPGLLDLAEMPVPARHRRSVGSAGNCSTARASC